MAPPPPGGDPKDPPPIPPKSPVPPADRLKPIPRSSRTSVSTSPTVVPESAVARLEGPERVTERIYSPAGTVREEDVDVFEDSIVPTSSKQVPTDIAPEPSDNSEDGLMLLPPYNPGKSKPPPLEPPRPTVADIKAKLTGRQQRKPTADVIADEAEKVLKYITEREAAPKSTPPKNQRSRPVPELDATGAFAIGKPSQPPPAPKPPLALKSVTPAPDREAKPMPKAVPKKPVLEPMFRGLSRFAGEILWLALTVLSIMIRGLGFAVIQLAEFWARLPRPEQSVIQMSRAEMVRMIEAIVEQKLRERQDKQAVLPMVLPELQLPSLAAPPPAPAEILEALAEEDDISGPSIDDWVTPPDAPVLEDALYETYFRDNEPPSEEPPPPVMRTPAEALARRQKFTAAAILVVAVLIPVIFWVIVGQFGGITALLHGHIATSTE